MIHPLVIDAERTFYRCKVRDGILREHSHIVGVDHLRNTVVNLRVDMIRTTREDNAVMTCLFHPFEYFLALPAHLIAHGSHLFPAGVAGFTNFLFRKIGEDADQTVGEDLFRCERKERIHECNIIFFQMIHVVFDILRIACDNRTVVMVHGIGKLFPLIWQTRIPDGLYALGDQPLDMAV